MALDVELAAVTKRYGDTIAVDAVSLRVPAGTYCCLLGPSGCGKTSTLRMIAGHEVVTDGDILLGGTNITNLPPARRRTAMMFQSYALFPHLDCLDNVAFSLKMRGEPKDARRARAREMLARVQMDEYAARLPAQLSGGQQQRVALARALITDPMVLLLDEPLSALDPFLRARMREELKQLQKRLGITFIHVTHSQEEAMALADLVVVMDQGRIVQAAAPREVFNRPATRFVARFIGGHCVLPAKLADGDLEVANSLRMRSPPVTARQAGGGTVHVAIRADRLRLAASPGPGLAGTVTGIEYLGTTMQIGVAIAALDPIAVLMSEQQFDAAPMAIGQPVHVAWDPADMHVLGN